MKKVLLIGLLVIVVAVGGGVYWLMTNLDGLVKTAIEETGSKVTKVPVTLSGVSLSLQDGRGTLSGLTVANPAGFKTPYLAKLSNISVKIDTKSLTESLGSAYSAVDGVPDGKQASAPPIIIDEIRVTSPDLIYELASPQSNVAAVQKNVEQFTGGSGSSSADSEASSGEPKVIIRNVYITGAKVQVSAAPLGGKTMTSELPDLHLTDIGKKTNGATAAEAAKQIMAAVTDRVGSFVGKLDISNVLQGVAGAGDLVKNLGLSAGGNIMDSVKNVAEQAQQVQKVQDAVKSVTGGASGGSQGSSDLPAAAGSAIKNLLKQ